MNAPTTFDDAIRATLRDTIVTDLDALLDDAASAGLTTDGATLVRGVYDALDRLARAGEVFVVSSLFIVAIGART